MTKEHLEANEKIKEMEALLIEAQKCLEMASPSSILWQNGRIRDYQKFEDLSRRMHNADLAICRFLKKPIVPRIDIPR